MKGFFAALQQLGRAMMLPIAVLPVAALLLRLGQPDLLDMPTVATAGDAIFANLGLLFAIGIAVGWARENHGAAGLAGVVAYLIATQGAEILIVVPPDLADLAAKAFRSAEIRKLSVPAGILSGLIAGILYNRFSDVRLPAYLSFFGGRRFVPIVAGFAGVLLAFAFGYGFPVLEHGMTALSRAVLGAGEAGLFVYGVLNRALIVTGLHHIANNLAWFVIGDYNGATGDLKRFFAGDPTAGAFMSGFFPVMMFGLPAACLAMYRAARPERRKAVGGLLMSMALTSFLTGVTEPIEFAFMFLAPILYAVHAVLTGLAMVIMDLLGIRLGFGFSAGLFDYVLNFSQATNPWLLIPVGLGYFGLYYVVFRWAIARFNLSTPGRETDPTLSGEAPDEAGGADEGWITALGGAANLELIDACTTRLRLVLADGARVDDMALRRLGARGLVRPAANVLQVVVGPVADQLAGDLRRTLRRAPQVPPAQLPAEPSGDVAALVAALGGRSNLAEVSVHSSRVRVTLRDPDIVRDAAVLAAGFRGAVRAAPGCWHVLAGPQAADVARALQSR